MKPEQNNSFGNNNMNNENGNQTPNPFSLGNINQPQPSYPNSENTNSPQELKTENLTPFNQQMGNNDPNNEQINVQNGNMNASQANLNNQVIPDQMNSNANFNNNYVDNNSIGNNMNVQSNMNYGSNMNQMNNMTTDNANQMNSFSLNNTNNQDNPFLQQTVQNPQQPNNYMNNPDFPNQNQTEMVPPIDPPKKEKLKKKANKLFTFFIVFLLIAIVAGGIYYFLTSTKPKKVAKSVNPMEVNLEMGDPLSDNINDYAKITGFSTDQCTLNTENVDPTKTGRYIAEITCGTITKESVITIKDTKAPDVIAKKVYTKPNPETEIPISSFIEKCTDKSGKCYYQLDDSNLSLQTLASTIGNHKITIIVTDDYDNEVKVETELVVLENIPTSYLICTKDDEDLSDIKATLSMSYRFYIDPLDNLSVIQKGYSYKFNSIEDYNTVKKNYETMKKINDKSGLTYFDEDELTIIMYEDVSAEEIRKELIDLPNTREEIKNYSVDLGNKCTLKIA